MLLVLILYAVALEVHGRGGANINVAAGVLPARAVFRRFSHHT